MILLWLKLFNGYKIYGKQNLPSGNYVLCCNHTCLLDPFLLGLSLKRKIRFMAKQELFKNKLFARVLALCGAFPVDRQGGGLMALRTGLKILNEGKILGIFPEGHRFKDGQIHEIKQGAAFLAQRGNVPAVPAYISGGYAPFKRLSLSIGAPIDPAGRSYGEISAEIEKAIRELSKKA